MRRFISVLLLSVLTMLSAVELSKVEKKVSKLTISVDQRVELMCAAQILADVPEISHGSAYNKKVAAKFASFKNCEAVKTVNAMCPFDFDYETPFAFMLHLGNLPDLSWQRDHSDALLKKYHGTISYDSLKNTLRDFAQKSDFAGFWQSNQDIYKKMIDYTIADLNGFDPVSLLEKYYNEKQNSYNLILSPSFTRHNYGLSLPVADNKTDIYSINSMFTMRDSIPYLDRKNLMSLVWHEFGHSYVNHLTTRYAKELSGTELLFAPIKENMEKIAYGEWEICINEHIIQAVVIRLYEQNFGSQAGEYFLRESKNNRFVYIDEIVEALKLFEKERDSKNITFSEYYPQIVKVFKELAKKDLKELLKNRLDFIGPINATIANDDKLVIIFPTGSDVKVSELIRDYSEKILKFMSNKFRGKSFELLADTLAVKRELSDSHLSVYGTVENNAFLNKYKENLPYTIKDSTIVADKEYTGSKLRFMTCLTHPQNKQKGMLVNTAVNPDLIQGINDVYSGSEDFLVFVNRENVLQRGFYSKKAKWEFDKSK